VYKRQLIKTARIFSLNPAECYSEDHEIGSISIGKRADLLLADISGIPGEYSFKLREVWIGGKKAV